MCRERDNDDVVAETFGNIPGHRLGLLAGAIMSVEGLEKGVMRKLRDKWKRRR